MNRHSVKSRLPAHTPGVPKGEELIRRKGREPGRQDRQHQRTARDATSINSQMMAPIDPRMPHLPPV